MTSYFLATCIWSIWINPLIAIWMNIYRNDYVEVFKKNFENVGLSLWKSLFPVILLATRILRFMYSAELSWKVSIYIDPWNSTIGTLKFYVYIFPQRIAKILISIVHILSIGVSIDKRIKDKYPIIQKLIKLFVSNYNLLG